MDFYAYKTYLISLIIMTYKYSPIGRIFFLIAIVFKRPLRFCGADSLFLQSGWVRQRSYYRRKQEDR